MLGGAGVVLRLDALCAVWKTVGVLASRVRGHNPTTLPPIKMSEQLVLCGRPCVPCVCGPPLCCGVGTLLQLKTMKSTADLLE